MTPFRRENLEAIRASDPALAELLERVEASDLLEILRSRSGDPVPAFRGAGRPQALHSLFDPVREADRLAAAVLSGDDDLTRDSRECYLYFEGLGGGYQIRRSLARSRPSYVLIVETDLSLVLELISKLDLSDILSDPRVHLLVDSAPEQTADRIRSTYLPAVMGPFLSVPLRPRVDLDPAGFAAHREAARRALDSAADDYTVQSGFGHVWTRNILTNLPLLALHPSGQPAIAEAVVASAGPSLEERRDELDRLRPGKFLIATDTSLPAVLAAGHLPDAVLTIDCQFLSYYHFLPGLPSASLLVAELAAHPSITRRARATLAVSSGHPLSRLAAAEIGGILPIDTSGGNVGHAAVSLAFELGAQSVHLLGSDFSYPFGKPYARGTFLFDYFAERAGRTAPAEAGITSILFRSTTVEHEEIAGGLRYTTRTLRAYRDRFVNSFAHRAAGLHPLVAHGLPIEFTETDRGPADAPRPNVPTGRRGVLSPEGVRRFLRQYGDAVSSLPDRVPVPSAEATGGFEDDWSVFATLYPLIAHLRRGETAGVLAAELVSQAKRTVQAMVQRAVMRW